MRHAIGIGLSGLFLLALAAPGFAGPVSSFTLPNGLEVVVIEDHRAPVVVDMVWYRIGAADEKPGISGIAHFLEHLMFKGTDTLKPDEFSDRVAAVGGSDNAFTSWDCTAFYQTVAADKLGMVMAMEADRMRHLKLTPQDVDTERKVILEERSMRVDNDPGALMTEQMGAAQFLNSHYGIPVIGWRQEMEKLSRAEALQWYRTYYAPNDAVFVVAGDADPKEVRKLADATFGKLASTPAIPARVRPQEPPQLAARRIAMSDARVADPYLERSYLAPQRKPGDQGQAAALAVLAELLGGNPATSVLGRRMQFQTQVATYTSASYDGTAVDKTTFDLAVVPAPGVTLAAAEAAMDGAIADFLAKGVDPADLARIKTQIRAGQIYGQDNLQGQATRYGEALATGLSVADVQAWPGALEAVTAQDVMAAARSVLVAHNSVTGWLTRPEGALPVDASAPAQVPGGAGKVPK